MIQIRGSVLGGGIYRNCRIFKNNTAVFLVARVLGDIDSHAVISP